MPKFDVEFRVNIEADNKDEAREKTWSVIHALRNYSEVKKLTLNFWVGDAEICK